MKLLSWDQQLGLASPRPYAANQNVKTQTPSKNETGAGCKSPPPGPRGGSQQRHIEVAQWTHPTAGSDRGSLEDLFHLMVVILIQGPNLLRFFRMLQLSADKAVLR